MKIANEKKEKIVQKQKIREHFDQVAANYSENRENGLSFISQKNAVFRLLEGVKGKIIDVGCGGGYMIPELSQKGFNKVYGIDISSEMITIAKSKVVKKKLYNKVNLLVGDIEHLPFSAGSFDAVISMGLIEYLPTYISALQSLYRILKPGGTLIITVPSKVCPHYVAHRVISFLYHNTKKICAVFTMSSSDKENTSQYNVNYVNPYFFDRLLAETGFRKVHSEQCNFVFYPIDKFFPRFSDNLNRKMEILSCSKILGWLGRQYIVKVSKLSGSLFGV